MSQRIEVLIPERNLKERVKELALEINRSFGGPITIISLLNGAFIFTADLIRYLKGVEVDFMKLKSYSGKERGDIKLLLEPQIPLKGKRVLVVDDILDSGESLKFAVNWVKSKGAKEVRTCVLLLKDVERDAGQKPDFFGFRVPNLFVVGYGLDLDERFRELPYIGYIKE